MRVLAVGGRFDAGGGRPSGLLPKIVAGLEAVEGIEVTVVNGGVFAELERILGVLGGVRPYDAVLWWPDVPNELPKTRGVKDVAPRTLLVASKSNRDLRYGTAEIVSRLLAAKANLGVVFEGDRPPYQMAVLDPLGNAWADSPNPKQVGVALGNRLLELGAVRRQATLRDDSAFGEHEHHPDGWEAFLELVRKSAARFHELVRPARDTPRLLGNASFRCRHGFPGARAPVADGPCNEVLVSRRNVDKREIGPGGFVRVRPDGDRLLYAGEHKPSVDAPIQVRLFQEIPWARFMLHGHVYVRGAPFTSSKLPCGAIEEVDEVLDLIETGAEAVNLLGHGCLIIGEHPDDMGRFEFHARPAPES